MVTLNNAKAYIESVLGKTKYSKSFMLDIAPHKASCDTITIDMLGKRIVNVDLNKDSLRWQFIYGSFIPAKYDAEFRKIRKDGWRSSNRPLNEANSIDFRKLIEEYIDKLFIKKVL